MPFKRAVWLQLVDGQSVIAKSWFQCPLSGQFGCNQALSSLQYEEPGFNAL